MSPRDIITLLLAVAAYYGGYGFITLLDRQWWLYVASAVLVAWLGLAWRSDGIKRGRSLAVFGGSLVVIEGVQQAGCGALAWGMTPDGRDLCVMLGGDTVYAVAVSLLLAALWTWRAQLWASQPQPK